MLAFTSGHTMSPIHPLTFPKLPVHPALHPFFRPPHALPPSPLRTQTQTKPLSSVIVRQRQRVDIPLLHVLQKLSWNLLQHARP